MPILTRKRDAASTTAREMKRPAAAIVGMAATLTAEWDTMDDDDRRACLATIDRQVVRLAALVAELERLT
ncbi:MAG: hypothetical protein JWO37_1042 [Acidimicrobiales bacterium]|jgi:signal transduction histidine kinase|nr:hypothetical protein [Acidimicrobiales bacterium]